MQDDSNFFEIFPWHKNFETGIEEIDKQHKKLVEILNILAAHLANRANPISLNKVFEELASYAVFHFKTEEGIWKKYLLASDSWFSEHEKTHQEFFEQVVMLKNQSPQDSLDAVIHKVVGFLTHWLAYHILDADKRMAKTVLAIKSGLTIEQAKIKANDEMSGSMQVLIETVLGMYDSLSSRTMDLMRERALREQAENALLESEEKWKFILNDDDLGESIWDWDIEHDLISQSKSQILPFDIIRDDDSENTRKKLNIIEADLEKLNRDFHNHMDGKSEFFHSKYRVKKENGGWQWFLTRGKIVSYSSTGKPHRMIGINTDITKRELADLIYNQSSQGMIVTDSNNIIIGCNPAFTDMTGYLESDVVGQSPSILASDIHDNEFFLFMWNELKNNCQWTGEIWDRKKNRDLFPAALNINAIKGEDGIIDHYIALYSDISEKVKQDKIIAKQANYDSLTKLPNRRYFQERLHQETKRSNRSNSNFALLFIDLDNFKEVNDSLGHEIGDKLLVESAIRISEHIRETDLVSRFGGDEFTVILADLHGEISAVEDVSEKIISSLSLPFCIDTNRLFISASIGITIYPNDADSIIDLIKNADQAMYEAKKAGRSCYRFFTASMQEISDKRQMIISSLRDSTKNNQLEIYYQPIINLTTGKLEKAEALLRWNHPVHGYVNPVEFIPLAEDSGQIIEIGDWVYKHANEQGLKWNRKYHLDLQISVNMSPIQFRTKNSHISWIEYLSEIGLKGSNSVIEITEGLLMEASSQVVDILFDFRDAGIEIALDDFGTGYSSLSYLNKLDIDYIKIDKTFVEQLSKESRELALCEAIIVMAHQLDIKVIAEGVETEEQLNILTQIHCDFVQGFFYSAPLSADAFEKRILQSELYR